MPVPAFQRFSARCGALGLGLALAIAAALLGVMIERASGLRGVAVLAAVAIGMIAGNNRWADKTAIGPGASLASEKLLRWAIVLLGTQVAFTQVLRLGLRGLSLILTAMLVVAAAVAFGARFLKLPAELGVLLAGGMAICGNTAIAVMAPVLRARPVSVSTAVAAVTAYGTVALFTFPLVARLLNLGDIEAGLWIGVAINDTSQVLGASAAVSQTTLDTATVVKLIRNAFIAPVVIAVGLVNARANGIGRSAGAIALIRTSIPPFVIAFFGAIALRSAGVLPAEVIDVAGGLSRWLILVALAGIGLQTRFDFMRAVGWRPYAVGIGAAGLMALVMLILVTP